MVDFARALVGAGRRRRHVQLPLHRAGTEDSGSRAGAGGLLSRGDRRGARQRRRARARALHRRQVDGRPHRHAGRGRRSELRSAGLVLLGYPLHPPGKPTERRDKHLPAIGRPMLFVQGTRDAFGTPDELAPVLAPLRPAPTRARRRARAITRSSCRGRIRPRRQLSTPTCSARSWASSQLQLHDVAAAQKPWRACRA